jgi:hypothetical protein
MHVQQHVGNAKNNGKYGLYAFNDLGSHGIAIFCSKNCNFHHEVILVSLPPYFFLHKKIFANFKN